MSHRRDNNLHDAQRLLDVIAPDGKITFQTFGERTKDQALNRILHGTLAEHAEQLTDLNQRGAGVFFMVNQGDMQGRKTANVQQVRSVFVDLDGAALAPIQQFCIPPHAIVETSPGRYHAYWRVADMPLSEFVPIQKSLIQQFDADKAVHDLPRVMRLPGFCHQKQSPFQTRLIEDSNGDRDAVPWQALKAILTPNSDQQSATAEKIRQKLPDKIPEGQRNNTLFCLAFGLRRQGLSETETLERLSKTNHDRCVPPISEDELKRIIDNAFNMALQEFMCIPYELWDSSKFIALTPVQQLTLLYAYRKLRHEGNGKITMTARELGHRYSARGVGKNLQALCQSGLLTQTRPPITGKSGAKRCPGRYSLKHLPVLSTGKAA